MWRSIQKQVETILLSQVGGPRVSITYLHNTLNGVKTALKREDVAMDAGLAGMYDFSVICPVSQFENIALPTPRTSKVQVDGKAYRVLAVEQDAAGATIRMHLGSELA